MLLPSVWSAATAQSDNSPTTGPGLLGLDRRWDVPSGAPPPSIGIAPIIIICFASIFGLFVISTMIFACNRRRTPIVTPTTYRTSDWNNLNSRTWQQTNTINQQNLLNQQMMMNTTMFNPGSAACVTAPPPAYCADSGGGGWNGGCNGGGGGGTGTNGC